MAELDLVHPDRNELAMRIIERSGNPARFIDPRQQAPPEQEPQMVQILEMISGYVKVRVPIGEPLEPRDEVVAKPTPTSRRRKGRKRTRKQQQTPKATAVGLQEIKPQTVAPVARRSRRPRPKTTTATTTAKVRPVVMVMVAEPWVHSIINSLVISMPYT